MTRYLLDSHIFLWWANADPRLNGRSVDVVRRSREVHVSAATIWELSIKISKGKLHESRSLLDLAEEFRFKMLPVLPEHAQAAATIGSHHRDPFDRMLLVQAKIEGLTLVTHDNALSHYGLPVLLV